MSRFMSLVLWSQVCGAVQLHPQGRKYVCPGVTIKKILTCMANGTHLNWNVTAADDVTWTKTISNRILIMPSILGKGVTARLVPITSSTTQSELNLSIKPESVPIEVICSTSHTLQMYSIEHYGTVQ